MLSSAFDDAYFFVMICLVSAGLFLLWALLAD